MDYELGNASCCNTNVRRHVFSHVQKVHSGRQGSKLSFRDSSWWRLVSSSLQLPRLSRVLTSSQQLKRREKGLHTAGVFLWRDWRVAPSTSAHFLLTRTQSPGPAWLQDRSSWVLQASPSHVTKMREMDLLNRYPVSPRDEWYYYYYSHCHYYFYFMSLIL